MAGKKSGGTVYDDYPCSHICSPPKLAGQLYPVYQRDRENKAHPYIGGHFRNVEHSTEHPAQQMVEHGRERRDNINDHLRVPALFAEHDTDDLDPTK